MHTNSVTLTDIVKIIKETTGITVGRTVVHEMLIPSKKKTINSRQYKSSVSARVPASGIKVPISKKIGNQGLLLKNCIKIKELRV